MVSKFAKNIIDLRANKNLILIQWSQWFTMIHYYKYWIDILSHVNAEHEQTRRDDIVYDLDHGVLTVK